MNSNKIVIALFEKLKGHFIDWFDLKYVYHTIKWPKREALFWPKNMIFQGKPLYYIIMYNYTKINKYDGLQGQNP